MADIDKSIMSVLRKPKAARPIVRHGVTRAGTVGVEIEHQGVKGWGRDMDAATMSWQQNRAMAKRHDVGKSDAWEVPMDHFSPALPQRRPNYGTGNTVGKRMTGAVTGVAKPKKLQPTATAPRKAAGMLPIGTPPIAPSLVGKAAPHPLASISGGGFSRRDAILAGALGGGIGGGAGGYLGLKREQKKKRARTVDKRDRQYSPEHNRQRRLGFATAGAGIGGAAAIGSGVREVRRDSAALRDIDPSVVHVPGEPSKPRTQRRTPEGRMASLSAEEHAKEQAAYNERLGHRARRLQTREGLERARSAGHQGVVVSRHAGGKLALGTGLLASAAGMSRYARSRANREYS